MQINTSVENHRNNKSVFVKYIFYFFANGGINEFFIAATTASNRVFRSSNCFNAIIF